MMSRILAAAVVFDFLLATPPVDAAGATIRGRIVAADTGQPLRRAKVTVSRGERTDPAGNQTATTDADGRYTIADVLPGKYTLSVFRSGYLPMQYGQRRPLEAPRLLEVTGNAVIDRADFALQRMAVISGRITDERGEPVAGVLVLPMRSVYVDGRRQLAAQQSAAGFNVRTDDTGRYRISSLVPGSYVLMATARDTWTVQSGGNVVKGFAPTFFPGTTDVVRARPVTVAYAEQKGDVNFSLMPVRTVRVSGTALDSQGKPLAGRRIGLTQPLRGAGGGGGFAVGNATVAPDGTFVLPHVLPGEYKLQARGPSPGPGRDDEAAAQTITVTNRNVDGIVIKTTVGWSIAGHIRTENGAAPNLAPSAARVIATVPDATNPRGGPPGGKTRINEDWTFTVSDLFGPARLRLNLPDDWTLKAIERDGRDVTDSTIEGTPGHEVTDVRIVITNQVTIVSGRTVAANGAATTGGTVIVFAAESRQWRENSRFVRAVRPGDDGVWRISGLPPGEFFAVAVDYVPEGMWNDPEYLATLRARAQKITVADSGTPLLTLRVVESS
jgi:protocatechuate 3,4-dioxygenase beta subunit